MTHEEILSMLGDYVDYLIANSSAEAPMWNIEKVRSGKPNKWNYIDGCMITACLSLYKTTGDEKYLEFSKEFIDYFVQPDGSIKTYDPKEYNLDNVNQGKNLFILYDIYGDEKYRKPIDPMELVYPKELPLFDKYDEYLPEELVKKGFALGVLDVDGLREKVLSWEN